MRIKAEGQPELASPDPVKFSRAALPDAPADGSLGEAKRARNGSSTDIAFADGRVLVAGISNGEFSSVLRAIPCRFRTVDQGTVVENYHGAHGKFETRVPVRALGPDRVGGESHLLAAYTCTPLVECAPSHLKPGATITGKNHRGVRQRQPSARHPGVPEGRKRLSAHGQPFVRGHQSCRGTDRRRRGDHRQSRRHAGPEV